MINDEVIMASQVYGQFPISVATSLALEGLFGLTEGTVENQSNRTNKPNHHVANCDVVACNIKTIYRNVMGSFDKIMRDSLSVESIVNAMISDINTAKSVIDTESVNSIKLMVYYNKYMKLKLHYPKAIFAEANTDKQKAAERLEEKVLELFKHRVSEITDNGVLYMDTMMDISFSGRPKVFLITHLPIDLLHVTGESKLALLESHTGVVKYSNQWYTKLKGGSEYYRIPFDRMSIQMFGDSGGMFKPYELKMRKVLLSIAEKKRWTQATTKSKIVSDVMSEYEPILAAIIGGLY